MARGLRGKVRRRPVEAAQRRERDATQLLAQHGREAARVLRTEAGVLVELQDACPLAGEAAASGVGTQRRVHVKRRASGRQQQSRVRGRTEPIGDQFGSEQPDTARVGQDQWGWRQHPVSFSSRTTATPWPEPTQMPRQP